MAAAMQANGPWRRVKRAMIYAVLGAWSAVCLFPVYWLAVTSLKGEWVVDQRPTYIPFVDFPPTLESWRFILSDPYESLVPRFFNSAVIGLSSAAITVLAGVLAIYSLTRFPRRWLGLAPGWIMSGFLATRLLPPIMLVLPLYMMAEYTHTRDTLLALSLAYAAVNLPAAVWLLQPVLGGRASEQEEAALLEGASHVRIMFGIVLPMAAGSVAAVGLLIFMLCWNEYLLSVFLASDHAMTLPGWLVGQLSMKEAQANAEAVEWARFSAASLISALPLVAMTLVVQRFLARQSLWRR